MILEGLQKGNSVYQGEFVPYKLNYTEMHTYIASRLTGGNRIFPDQITIDASGVTLKEPGLFSGEEKTIPFTRISSVEIDCPLIGFSSITIETTGEGGISVDGFTKDEVTEMKKLILEKM